MVTAPRVFKDWPQEIHPERLWIVDNMGECRGARIMDVGCGAHKTIPEAVGVDIRPVTDIQCSIDEIPGPENTVDYIISRHSLEHMIDPIKTLKNWHFILRPGGKVLIILPDHSRVDTMCMMLSAGTHMHAYTPDSFKNLIELTWQFDIQKIETVVEDWSFGVVLEKV